MNVEELREFCLSMKGTEDGFPFGEDTLVFKVMGKVFCLVGLNSSPLSFNVKCEPGKALELREHHAGVSPGYHMDKKHWNTVTVDGMLSDELLRTWIVDSYVLVVKGLPKKVQAELNFGE